MFFRSIKEMNRLISKGMSNVKLKVTNKKNWRSQNFFEFVSRSQFGELQLIQILLNSKFSYCNWKIRGLREKVCVILLVF